MKSNDNRILWIAGVAAAAALWTGCQTNMPAPSGFLSTYSNLTKFNDSTWRYVNTNGLAAFDKFAVVSVKVLPTQYWDTTLTPQKQQIIADRFQAAIVKALSGRYQVVDTPSATTAEIRAAITSAYKVGNSLAMGVEGEILDPTTKQQLAAVKTYQISGRELGDMAFYSFDFDNTTDAYWDRNFAYQIMLEWAERLRKAIDEVHKP